MKEAVVIWAKRTPFGKYGGALRHLEPEATFQNLKQTFPEVMDQVDDVVLGNVVGNGGNVARKSLLAGLNHRISGITLDRQCGSGLESIIYACRMVQCEVESVHSWWREYKSCTMEN